MPTLIFKRARREPIKQNGQVVIKINAESYNKVLEVADESGESLRAVVSKMVDYAYENVEYASDAQ